MSQDKIDINALKRDVLMRTDMVATIGRHVPLKKHGVHHIGCCPFHGEKTGSFYVTPQKRVWKCFGCGVGGNVIDFMMRYFNLKYPQAVTELASECGIISETGRRLIPAVSKEQMERERQEREAKEAAERSIISEKAIEIWARSKGQAVDMVEKYLAGRGIDLSRIGGLPPTLRFNAFVWNVEKAKNMPAMIGAIQNVEGEVVAVHRTWLAYRADGSVGKADLEKNKMMLGKKEGNAIRLSALYGDHIYLAEGIETGLSIRQVLGKTVWVTTTLENFGNINLPPLIKKVTLCLDNDSKEKDEKAHAAIILKAAERLVKQGRKVYFARPPKGMDFNDWLQSGGVR